MVNDGQYMINTWFSWQFLMVLEWVAINGGSPKWMVYSGPDLKWVITGGVPLFQETSWNITIFSHFSPKKTDPVDLKTHDMLQKWPGFNGYPTILVPPKPHMSWGNTKHPYKNHDQRRNSQNLPRNANGLTHGFPKFLTPKSPSIASSSSGSGEFWLLSSAWWASTPTPLKNMSSSIGMMIRNPI